jgi:hypothetical protein
VKKKKADLGLALDPDADRLALVGDEGVALSEELTLALAVDFILAKNKSLPPDQKIVVTNLSTSRIIDDLVKKHGGAVIRTRVGEINVAEKMQRLKALIGGEGNGGVIYPRVATVSRPQRLFSATWPNSAKNFPRSRRPCLPILCSKRKFPATHRRKAWRFWTMQKIFTKGKSSTSPKGSRCS